MKIINLTPHDIHLYLSNGEVITYPSEGLARVESVPALCGTLDGIPVRRTTYAEVTGLPAPVDGVVYLTSLLVASRVPHRDDVLFPDNAVRNDQGQIIGCRAWGKV
jgi:hypothetical protein